MWTQISVAIWLFPIAFMLHDFEEIVVWEAWMGKNRDAILARLPRFLGRRMATIVRTSTPEVALTIALIFLVTVVSTLLAAQWEWYGALLVTSGMFFIHGFGHFAQAIALRKYVPGVVTSAVVIMPFGIIFFPRLIADGIVDLPGLLLYFAAGAVLMVPFILGMHMLGGYLYPRVLRALPR